MTPTSIGYCPDCTLSGGVAVTLIVLSPPASIETVWALASAVGDAVDRPALRPVGSNVNVCSSGVLLVTVRLYENAVAGVALQRGEVGRDLDAVVDLLLRRRA